MPHDRLPFTLTVTGIGRLVRGTGTTTSSASRQRMVATRDLDTPNRSSQVSGHAGPQSSLTPPAEDASLEQIWFGFGPVPDGSLTTHEGTELVTTSGEVSMVRTEQP